MSDPRVKEQEALAAEMAESVRAIFADKPLAACLWAIGTLMGWGAANARGDLDTLLERLRPIMECQMKATLERWQREDAERQRPN